MKIDIDKPLRLNNRFFKEDLKEFLLDEGGINEDGTPIGSYMSVWNWILSYDGKVKENNEKILQILKNAVPNRYITITPTMDDISSFCVNIWS